MNAIEMLFAIARHNPQHPMNRAGRLTGRHCVGRRARGIHKRIKRKQTPFNTAGVVV